MYIIIYFNQRTFIDFNNYKAELQIICKSLQSFNIQIVIVSTE
jgi:hypothetical protein